MSDSENAGDSDGEDLANRSLQVTKSPEELVDLVSLLECPVCLDLPLPPIRTCLQGHIICASCCPKLSRCPLCLQDIGRGRNFFAEDFLNKSIIQCKFHEDGCRIELPGAEIREHGQKCFYRPIKCPECKKWTAFIELEDHLYKKHQIGQWDLNDEGELIVKCLKRRTKKLKSK